MPLYMCSAPRGVIDDAAKPKIAADITRIHCDVTGAPPQFVHAFFVEDTPAQPLGDKKAFLFGSIRAGRTDAQKAQIVSEMQASIHTHTGIALDDIIMATTDVPASWVLEGGEVMPEPGEEAAWLAKHAAHEPAK
ncbi:MAG: tautomerase family protein [Pseudomonadota bacterium]